MIARRCPGVGATASRGRIPICCCRSGCVMPHQPGATFHDASLSFFTCPRTHGKRCGAETSRPRAGRCQGVIHTRPLLCAERSWPINCRRQPPTMRTCCRGSRQPPRPPSLRPADWDYVFLVTDEADVRQLALALPGTSEGTSYGTCSWRVGDRVFLRVHEEHGVLVAWCEDEHAKASLLANEPDKFFTTQHYTGHASVLVRLAVVDRPRLADLVLDAWRARASGRFRRELEEG